MYLTSCSFAELFFVVITKSIYIFILNNKLTERLTSKNVFQEQEDPFADLVNTLFNLSIVFFSSE